MFLLYTAVAMAVATEKNLIRLCTFLKFHAHVEVNSARLFQNVLTSAQGPLILYFQENRIFHEHRHTFCKVAP